MTREKALEYMDMPVRVYYKIGGLLHAHAGMVTHVTKRKLILLAFNGEEDDFEIYAPLKGIKRIYELKPKDDAGAHENIP